MYGLTTSDALRYLKTSEKKSKGGEMLSEITPKNHDSPEVAHWDLFQGLKNAEFTEKNVQLLSQVGKMLGVMVMEKLADQDNRPSVTLH